MFSFLYPTTKPGAALDRGHRTFMRHDYVQAEMKKNLDRAVEFHSSRKDYINNDNIFIQLIRLLPTIDDTTQTNYLRMVTEILDTFTTAFGFSTENNYGDVLEYNVYGNVPEVWMSVTGTPTSEPFFKVLRHPFTHTNLPAFTGSKEYRHLDKHDIAVFSLDIPRFAVDYRKWDIENRKLPLEEQEDAVDYVSKVIMPMLLPTHQEVAVFNYIFNRAFGGRTRKDERLVGLMLIDVSSKLQGSVDEIVDHLIGNGVDMREMLAYTPTVDGRVIGNLPGAPGLDVYRPMRWASMFANIPLLTFGLGLTKINGAPSGKHTRNDIKKVLKNLRNDSATRNQLDDKVAKLLKDEIDAVHEVL